MATVTSLVAPLAMVGWSPEQYPVSLCVCVCVCVWGGGGGGDLAGDTDNQLQTPSQSYTHTCTHITDICSETVWVHAPRPLSEWPAMHGGVAEDFTQSRSVVALVLYTPPVQCEPHPSTPPLRTMTLPRAHPSPR